MENVYFLSWELSPPLMKLCVTAISVFRIIPLFFEGIIKFHPHISASTEEVHLTPEGSPELTKRSWFGSLMGSERDEAYTILVRGKPLATVKADLIHAFLSVSETQLMTLLAYNHG